jgi:hypothetical protein
MQRVPCPIDVTAVVATLFLVLPALAGRSDAQVLRYVVRADPFEVELSLPDGTTQVTRPGRDAAYFYFLSENGWPVPDGVNDTRIRCEIRWEGFPAGWHLVNSFGIDRRKQEFTTTLGGLRKAVFAGGDFRIARSKKGLFLVTRDAWTFSDVEATDFLDRIAEAQADVWRDRGLSGHLVYLLGTDKPAGQWGGEARTESMVLQISRDTPTPADVALGIPGSFKGSAKAATPGKPVCGTDNGGRRWMWSGATQATSQNWK